MQNFSQAPDSLIAIIQCCQDRTMNATFIDYMNLMKLPIVLQQEMLNSPKIAIIIAIVIIIIIIYSQYVFIQERGRKKGTWIGENEIPHGIKRAPSRPSLLLNRLSFRRLQHHPRPKAFYPAVCRNTYCLPLSSLYLFFLYIFTLWLSDARMRFERYI
jgi:hypothetical protein